MAHNLQLLRASGWSVANGKTDDECQPHLFYRAGEVDEAIDKLIAQHEFEHRRWNALEAFYLKELGKD